MSADRVVIFGCVCIACFLAGLLAATNPPPQQLGLCRANTPNPLATQLNCTEARWICSTRERMEKVQM